jgi:hypothetical protein
MNEDAVRGVRSRLNNLKTHLDQVERWVAQATNLIYEVEEKLFDIEDNGYKNRYEGAGSGIFVDPPRSSDTANHCGRNYIDASSYFQSVSEIKKIVND